MEEDFHFNIDHDKDGHLTLQWDDLSRPNPSDGKLMEQCRAWFRKEIRRLRRIKNIEWKNFPANEKKNYGIPDYEWDTIVRFLDSNVVAMTLALESLGPSPPPEKAVSTKGDIRKLGPEDDDYDEDIVVFNKTTATTYEADGSHYDPLNWEFDDLDYAKVTCDNRDRMKFKDYDALEFTKTTYQRMTFVEKNATDDICMDLDDIVQICASYRPQYHEYVTHAAARFVQTIKRVIFIGGGDSMLLHEALRYPDVELVVGLELDQTVTRKCFKHLKSSPHFDDERVEWWFGDATKSLLLLPEDYWGSFDLVLVDLSETVMSFSVTKELDVFDALALLLNPVGVMVKNEMYMEKFSRVFDYSMDVYFTSPVICSQVLAFGSNNVDFFHAPTYDHGIETLLYGNMHDPDTRYDLMHDYRKNIAPASVCNQNIPDEPTEQRTAAGICEIVNVENVTIDIDEKKVGTILSDVAKKVGFTIVADSIFDSRMVVLVLKEGYIAARLWPTKKYIGLDINLWGSTYKIDTIREELVKAVGSNDVSSYRVVVGGMYGSNTWKDDQKILGPKLRQLRNCEKDVVAEGRLDRELASGVSVAESVVLTLEENITAVVVCGGEVTPCSSVDVLKKHSKVANVIVLRECRGLKGSKILEDQFVCESKIATDWETALIKAGNTKTNLLVMDASTSFKMHQIVSSILSKQDRQVEYLAKHSIVVTWSNNKDDEKWRREFLDRFRKAVQDDPVARAEIVFQAGSTTSEFGILSTSNNASNYAFEKLEKTLRQRLPGTSIELRKIHGGLFNFQKDWNPKIFTMSDYDDGKGKAQFDSQQPLGRQNIFQLVRTADVEDGTSLDLSLTRIWICLKSAMGAVRMRMTLVRQFPDDVGDGGIIFAFTDLGNVIVVWDGREHIDLNFFTYDEMEGTPEKFMGAFLHKVERKLTVGLRDDQPRGIGKVVNFPSDLVEVPPSKRSGGKKKTKRKLRRPVKKRRPKTSSSSEDEDDDDDTTTNKRHSSKSGNDEL
jgi:spermidine synthase/S-adenosylmethionine/arginine decarboxylase-like enzyme